MGQKHIYFLKFFFFNENKVTLIIIIIIIKKRFWVNLGCSLGPGPCLSSTPRLSFKIMKTITFIYALTRVNVV
jgi:hypothetical protein